MKKKGFVCIIMVIAATQFALAAGAGDYAIRWIDEVVTGGELISASLEREHGISDFTPDTQTSEEQGNEEYTSVPVVFERPIATASPTPTSEIFELPTEGYGALSLDNRTDFYIDSQALMNEGMNISLEENSPQVLIIHTHGTESFTQGIGEIYSESDYMRTTDTNYNVIALGNIMTDILTQNGISVIHDTSLYDYPSYSGSYSRSAEAIEAHLSQHPTIKIVFDIHRDAIGEGDTIFRTYAEVEDKASAQVMLLVGTGANGLEHPNWEENLKLALLLQKCVTDVHPTLMRPTAIVEERYNQQLTTGSLILEIGSTGNTFSEALIATEIFSEAISPVLASLIG